MKNMSNKTTPLEDAVLRNTKNNAHQEAGEGVGGAYKHVHTMEEKRMQEAHSTR